MFVLIVILAVIGHARSAGDLDFSIIDADGQSVGENVFGLLLSRGDLVYSSGFSDNSADAICREMGYAGHTKWIYKFAYQLADFDAALDDVVCSSGDWSNCTYSMIPVTGRPAIFLSCTHFSLVDRNGAPVGADKLGLLLYNGGSVCSGKAFSDNSADAVCRLLGYVGHRRWTSGKKWSIQLDFNITLGDVRCGSPDWSTCSSRLWPNCYHFRDVFLQCFMDDWKPVIQEDLYLNMMETPLEILTDSNLGFRDVMAIFFYSSEEVQLGSLVLKFRKNAVKKDLWECYHYPDRVDLPTACARGGFTVWRFTWERKPGPALSLDYTVKFVLHCNDEEVFRNMFDPAYCASEGLEDLIYGGQNVTKISFYEYADNVSRFYRPYSPQ